TDLRRLLTEEARPQAELALALEGEPLGVDAADEHEVAVDDPRILARHLLDDPRVRRIRLVRVQTVALGIDELDHLRVVVGEVPGDRGGGFGPISGEGSKAPAIRPRVPAWPA